MRELQQFGEPVVVETQDLQDLIASERLAAFENLFAREREDVVGIGDGGVRAARVPGSRVNSLIE